MAPTDKPKIILFLDLSPNIFHGCKDGSNQILDAADQNEKFLWFCIPTKGIRHNIIIYNNT